LSGSRQNGDCQNGQKNSHLPASVTVRPTDATARCCPGFWKRIESESWKTPRIIAVDIFAGELILGKNIYQS
jgi:hypothetical protein